MLMGFGFSERFVKVNTAPGLWNIQAPWWRFLLRYDSAFYLDIAKRGYGYNGNPLEAQRIVFFPGYPLLFGAVSRILPISLPFSAVLVSNLCALGAIVLLFSLVRQLWDEEITLVTVAAISLFPASLFLSAAYSESAGLLFTLAAFVLLFRGRIALAAVCAGCLSAIRPLGFLMSIPVIYVIWQNAGRRLSARFLISAGAAGLTAVSGLLAFVAYCWIKFHDPLAFVHARAAWRVETGLAPGLAALRQMGAPVDVHYLPNLSDAWFFALFAAIAIVVWKRAPMELNLYTASAFLALIGTRVLQEQGFISMNRYLLLVFPCMIGMALIGRGRAWLTILVSAVFGAMLFMHSALFAQWYWAG